MKRLGPVILGFVLMVSAGTGWADSISTPDPTMIIDTGGDPLSITGMSLPFSSNGQGGGVLEFQNDSGVHWENLLVTTVFPGGDLESDYFFGGTAYTGHLATLNGSTLSVLFFDLPVICELCGGSIPSGVPFSINLNDFIGGLPNPDPNGSGGWGPNHQFFAQANVPEPGSYLLLLTGLAGLAVRSRVTALRQRGARRNSSSSFKNSGSD